MSRHGRWAIALWVLGLGFFVCVVAQTRFTTDMSAFLPSAPEPAQRLLVDQLRDGVASRLILIGIAGSTPGARTTSSRLLADALRKNDDLLMVDNGDGAIGASDQAFVWTNRYLLSPDSDGFSSAALHRGLERDLELLASGLEPLLGDSVAHDPTGQALALGLGFAGSQQRRVVDGVWTSADGARALLLVQTRAPGVDIDAQARNLAAVQTAFDASRRSVAGGDALKLLVTGPGSFAVAARAQMKHDVSLYSAAAIATIVGLLLGVYRSPLLVVLTLAPVATGALAGLAAVSLSFGFVHGVTLGFGVTLIGEAVDYTIYFFTRTARGDRPASTIARIWPTLRIGVLVSICGFAAMLFSSFSGFVQLGLFTIVGLAVALIVTRFVLPHLVPRNFAGVAEIGFSRPLLKLARGAVGLRPALLLLVGIAAVGVGLRGNTLWQRDLASLSPISAEAQTRDRELRRDIGAPDVRYLIVATAPSCEALLQRLEQTEASLQRLIPAGGLSGFDSPTRYLPSQAEQARRQALIPDRPTLERNLDQALVGLPFRAGSFAPFLEDVEAARRAAPLTPAALAGTALALRFDAMAIDRRGSWAGIMPLTGVTNPGAIMGALSRAGTGAVFVDLKTESDRLLVRYQDQALLLSATGALAITALLLGYFRSLRRCAVVLAPLVVAVVLTIAILSLRQGELSIFNIFGLLLVVAVGSNYCLFLERGELYGETGERTVMSLLLANICTVIGFGVLSLSTIPVLAGIGETVAIGAALSLVAALVLGSADRHCDQTSTALP